MSLAEQIKSSSAGYYFGKPDAADLELINKWSGHLPYQEADVFVFAAEAANGNLRKDQPWRFGQSSLRQFAADAGGSVPYLIQHERRGRVPGYTFGGHYDEAQNSVRAAIFLARGVVVDVNAGLSSDSEIEDIQKGLRRSVSVGPAGNDIKFVCDACGEDVFSAKCGHLPGMHDEAGKLITATLENASLCELSGVDNGAVPNAFIMKAGNKAHHLLTANALASKDFTSWCEQMKLPSNLRTYSFPSNASGNNNGNAGPTGGKDKSMSTLRDKVASAFSRRGLAGLATAVIGLDAEANEDNIASRLAEDMGAEVKVQVDKAVADNPLLAALKAAELDSVEKIVNLSAMAKHGETYLSDLRSAAKELAIKAYGQEDGKEIGAQVDSLSLDAVKKLTASWQATVNAKFKDGNKRRSVSSAIRTAASAEDTDNDNDGDDAAEIAELMAMSPAGQAAARAAAANGNGHVNGKVGAN